METLANNTLRVWQEQGRQLIPQNFAEFRRLLLQAKDLQERGNYEAAAVYAQIAANYAQLNHCGFFVSQELEQLLVKIGREAITSDVSRKNTSSHQTARNILHVSTHLANIGGISRLMWRWIKQDSSRSHCVALTRQALNQVPENLKEAVCNSQGNIYALGDRSGGIISRAKRLRECAAAADIVVLHTWEYDVVPTIAFANKEQFPPIIYTNHGDHWFWVGATISDAVANLRESGRLLSGQRRGIEAKRNLVLPTILEPAYRKLTRSQAKQQLGIDSNSVMLLSIARSVKYKTVDGVNFADAHVELLQQYKQAILIVIGAGSSNEDWSAAIEQTQGRIMVLKETKDTAVYYQAADIYVDSFPFISITSILEAGSYGVPAVSRYPYSSLACGVLGSDMPGLDGNLIRVRDIQEYTAALSGLIEDEQFRLSLGEATKIKIAQTHWGDNWQSALNELYAHVAALPRKTATLDIIDETSVGEPDVFLPSVNQTNVKTVMHWHMPLLPLPQRLSLWLSLVKKYGFRNNPLNTLMSEKWRSHYYQWRSRY
ncbi:glycosyltransferase [Aliterella atlantica]|uniref:Glycosyl transferase family 1 n=1 Tax=Aliterella atlantica CENA595 TaxID=1618023 RepID=A0A0D8ZWM2_9CYAN|nr:glycosyltransferase [Aliterella atlantica]KJH73155.1 glycosyl transferase family 1 [Aliterella atlantica CENA595]